MSKKKRESEITISDEKIVAAETFKKELDATASARPEKQSLGVKFSLGVVQVLLMVGVLAGAGVLTKRMIADAPEARKRPAFKAVYTVDIITAEAKDRQPVFTAYGQTVAARSVDLRALVGGEVIRVNPKLRAGARVAKGEELIEIDSFEYEGALSEAQANLTEAEARIAENKAQIALEESKLASARDQLVFAQKDLKRFQQLKTRGTSTQKQLDDAEYVVSQREQLVALSQDTIKVQQSRVGQIKASIDRLKWRVQQARRNLESTTLVAPFDGIVRSSSAEIGRVLTANDVAVSLFEADSLEVKFTLTDVQYGRLQSAKDGIVGRNVEVVWSVGGREYLYPGQIDRFGAEIMSTRGGVEFFATVGQSDNTISIRPGAFVEVRVPDRVFENAIAVPDSSVYGTDTVYTAVDGALVENKVTVAAYDGEMAIISEGLNSGDKVLTTRITEVSAGLNVRQEGDPAPNRGGQPAGKPAQEPSKKPETPKTAASGRPTLEELVEIAKANNMPMAELRALPPDQRRELVRAFRKTRQ